MKGTCSKALWQVFATILVGFAVHSSGHAQKFDDPDPNSPTPILLTADTTNRVLTADDLFSSAVKSIRSIRPGVPIRKPVDVYAGQRDRTRDGGRRSSAG